MSKNIVEIQLKTKGSGQVKHDMKAIGGSVEKLRMQVGMLKDMFVGMQMMMLAVAAGAGIKAFVTIISSFSDAMSTVSTLVDTTKVDMKALGDGVLAMSVRVRKSANDLAAGLYQVISAGVDASDALQVLEASAVAASAGQSTTEQAVMAITKALNIYNLSAKDAAHISDLFFMTVKKGQTTFPELSNQIGRVLPFARNLGATMEGTLDVFAGMTTILGNTEQAATAMEATFRAFVWNAQKFKAAGIDIRKIISEHGLIGLFRKLKQVTGGSAEKLKALGFESEALRGILGLFGGKLKKVESDLKDFQNASGTAKEAFNKQMDSAKSALDAIGIAVARLALLASGDMLPAIKAVSKAIVWMAEVIGQEFGKLWKVLTGFPQGVIDFFRQLNAEMKKTKKQVDALAEPTPFQMLFRYLTQLGHDILSVFTFMGRTIGNVFASVVVDIINILGGLYDVLGALGNMIIAVFSFSPEQIKKAWIDWKNVAVSAISDVMNVGTAMTASIGKAWDDMIAEMKATHGWVPEKKPTGGGKKPGKPSAPPVGNTPTNTEQFGPSKKDFEEAKRKRIEALMQIKQFSQEYHLFRLKQLDELAQKMRDAGLAEVDIARWKADEIKKLNEQTYQFQVENATSYTEAITAKLKLMVLHTRNSFQQTAEFIGGIYRQLESTISNVLFDSMTGKLKTLGDYWKAFYTSVMKMLSDIAAEIIKTWVLKQSLKVAGLFHEGGVVLHGGGMVPEFHGGGFVDRLPRYHSGGLANDERFAVLQTRERVLSRDQNVMFGQMYSKVMQDNNQAAAPVIVQMTVNATDADSFNGKIMESKDAVAAAIMSATGNNHPIRRT